MKKSQKSKQQNLFDKLKRHSSDGNVNQQRILKYDEEGNYWAPERYDPPEAAHMNNKVRTSKYTWLTFLPMNLFEQIIRPANFYFCCIAVLQAIPEVSISGGTPSILVPLCVVFFVTGVKDFLEDMKRHQDDKLENERKVEKIEISGQYRSVRSETLNVGDIVRIKDGERFPADLLLITSAHGHKASYCYVETSNIDGETNLKLKQSPEGFNTLGAFDTSERMSLVELKTHRETNPRRFGEYKKRMATAVVECDAPDGHLDAWSGRIRDIKCPQIDDNQNDDSKDQTFEQAFENAVFEKRTVQLGIDNLLLRGSELRNSDWIYGLVIYSGFETKIFMNNKSRTVQRIKRSTVEKTMNRFIYVMAGIQFFVCLFCAIASLFWLQANSDAWYLDYSTDPAQGAFYKFFTWFIIFAQFIPISLLVSMEVVKYIQAHFMQWDIGLYTLIDRKTDKFCKVQNSNLNEELGQIEYVFSDKTGTLTENSLDFRKCVIGSENYGRGETEIGRAAKRREKELAMAEKNNGNGNGNGDGDGNNDNLQPILDRVYTLDNQSKEQRQNNAPHVNFDETDRLSELLWISTLKEEDLESHPKKVQARFVRRFLTVLAVNNSCYPVLDPDLNEMVIRAASPDDECLTCFAQFMGVRLQDRNPPRVQVEIVPRPSIQPDGFTENWEQLEEFEFTSKRKRMTVILRNQTTGQIHFTMKGADSEMSKYIHNYENEPNHEYSEQYLNDYSEEGLRTLIIAEAILPPEWWDDEENGWEKKVTKFREDTFLGEETERGHLKGSCSDYCRKCAFYDEIELAAKCQLLGVTAIEDKLQDAVPETISCMLDGNIKVWVLTGDKQKTAENIGIACNLLEPAMEKHGLLFRLTTADSQVLDGLITDAIQKINNENEQAKSNGRLAQPAGIVVASVALKVIVKSEELLPKFLTMSGMVKSVIGVRLQPNQKAQIIDIIKQSTGCITLAVGDGANDEPMIRTANVGVGIAGVEGTAAVRASDYAIGKFKFLKRLLFVHGRLHYRRIATLVCYMFYKNGLLSLSSFWFGLYNGFSGQILYLDWAYQLYNIVFTCIPILLYSVFERDYSDKYLTSHPELYQLSQKGEMFTSKIFGAWITDSLIASCLLVIVPLETYAYITSPDSTGQSAGLWTTGITILTAVVFVANLRLAFVTRYWTGWSHFVLWGSMVSYFISMIVFNLDTFWAKAGADYYWLVFRSMSTWRYWLVTLLCTVIALFIPFTYVAFKELRTNERLQQRRAKVNSQSTESKDSKMN